MPVAAPVPIGYIRCTICEINILQRNMNRHLISKAHKDKSRPAGAAVPAQERKSQNFFITTIGEDKHRAVRKLSRVKDDRFLSCIICREWDTGGTGTVSHLHMYLKTTEPVRVTHCKEYLTRDLKLKIDDIEVCRNVDRTISYVTKEDTHPYYYGVDFDKFNWSYKLYFMCEMFERVDYNHRMYRLMPCNYQKKFLAMHQQYWSEINVGTIVEQYDHHNETLWYEEFKEIFDNRRNKDGKKCVYLYGESGSGKTTSTMFLARFEVFQINTECERFAICGYNGERILLYDEYSGWPHQRNLLLGVAGRMPYKYDVKGEKPMTLFPHQWDFFVVTSNQEPPEDLVFQRRFHCINTSAELLRFVLE